mmetsp:Transcript_42881/g.96826  ORF Transcript_42881/g.96826 Transcript_42881/m.96826 type:complete len:165 (+) Transcript_42881:66-560(+)|eukprot:CAMPEP_0197938388 /NCGR_PEP_ID=MMETSP1439-20131203/118052_1 /TAXON_ID=66791 /ORGANISM="Gonyaulax spinifera, Strain CCMP409" /LENGTH=164 /DNA_ID=CAMNT_0043561455 /DNA_START=61 /DNA_END=555 /DNA_ORIENTATION=-
MYLPAQLSSASAFAKQQGRTMWFIICMQLVLTVLRLKELWDIWGGFVEGLTIGLGWYALREDLDISLVCIWGLVNLYLVAWDIVIGLTQLVFFAVQFRFTQCLIIVLLPLFEYLAASIAWSLFKDHELRGGLLLPLFKGQGDPGEDTPLMAGSSGKDQRGAAVG